MFKIETHLHTSHVSSCGWLEAPVLAEGCARAGYAALAVTDHYNRDTFAYLHMDTAASGAAVTDAFLEGFRRMEAACAPLGLKVYKGAELRFDECSNDYLLYNYPDELLACPEELFRMGIAAFAPLAREAGALLVQAHPYRKKCTPAIACYLDGVEVMNRNPRHENENDLQPPPREPERAGGGIRRAPRPAPHRRVRLPPGGGHRPGRHPRAGPAGGRRGFGPAAAGGRLYGDRRVVTAAGIWGPSPGIDCIRCRGEGAVMRKDRMIVFLLRRRYLLMALALAAAAVMFLAACLPDLLL